MSASLKIAHDDGKLLPFLHGTGQEGALAVVQEGFNLTTCNHQIRSRRLELFQNNTEGTPGQTVFVADIGR